MILEDLVNKTCLIGLSYLDKKGELLKQVQHSGRVLSVDKEAGINVLLDKKQGLTSVSVSNGQTIQTDKDAEEAVFTLPPLLSPWFVAPPGHYKNTECHIDMENPDYFVTWDIRKSKEETPGGEHEWWGWEPRLAAPSVN